MHEVEQCRTWVRSIKLISHLREHHCIVQCLQCHAMPKTWMDPALLQRCETLRSWPPGASEGSSWLSWQTCYIVAWVNSVHRSYRSYIIHYYILLYTIICYYILLYTIISWLRLWVVKGLIFGSFTCLDSWITTVFCHGLPSVCGAMASGNVVGGGVGKQHGNNTEVELSTRRHAIELCFQSLNCEGRIHILRSILHRFAVKW